MLRANVVLAGGLAWLVAAAVACASSEETDGPPPDPDAGADTAPPGPSPNGAPAIYVSTSGDDLASGASPAAAVKSIQVGLDRAAQCPGAPCAVLVAAGTYVHPVQLRDGISLYGGYAADFATRDPGANGPNATMITSTEERTLVADGLKAPTTVDGFAIAGGDLGTNDGRSSYALWVNNSGSALFVSNGTIQGGKAAAGKPGAPGAAVKCTAIGGTGGTSSDCGSETGADGNAAGDPKADGNGGGGGSNNCPSACPLVNSDGISDGADGKPGGNGTNGAGGGGAPNVVGAFTNGLWVAALAMDGTRGGHGTGGGGGGAGGAKRFRACFGCDTLIGGTGGAGGTGGCGGGGGGAGGAGGGSFGAVVIDSILTLNAVTVSGGAGGKGGAGGDGHAGDPGTEKTDTGRQDAAHQKCGLINYSSSAGGHGGNGGNGGAGGGGGGGVGGVSVGIVTIGNASVTRYDVHLQAGTAGLGGAGGKGPGSAGADGRPGSAMEEKGY